MITNPLYTWKITFNLHGTKVVTFFWERKNAWVTNKVAAYSCPNYYLKKKKSQCKINTVWWNQLLIEVLFCSCSSCLEELSFSAERVEIFYSTHQVTPQTLLHFLNPLGGFSCNLLTVWLAHNSLMHFVLQKHKKELERLLAR